MKPKVTLNEVPVEIQEFRVKAQERISAADPGVDRLKVFADCWKEEQDLWLKSYPDRAAAFEEIMAAEVENIKIAKP